MFTGIVTELGKVVRVEPGEGTRQLTIEAPASTKDLEVGDSIAVDGVCLTAVAVAGERFTVTVVEESLRRSTLGARVVGDEVDLERPMNASGRFDGHLVQGHVDGVGSLSSIHNEGDARRVRIGVPAELAPYLVEKGAVAVDGVSLTISATSPLDGNGSWFEMVLIPHTLMATVLGAKAVGDEVNVEVDVIAKYVERWMEARR